MEAEEIRTRIVEARQACADADCIGPDEGSAISQLAKLADKARELAEATEWLLAEREATAGRLRRTSIKPPADPAILVNIPPVPEQTPAIPSSVSDA